MMQFPFMNINARRGGVGPHGFLGVNPASARGFLHAGGAQGMGGHNVENRQVGMGGGATGGFGSTMQSGVGGSRGNVSLPGVGGFGGGAGFGGAMGGGSQPRRMGFFAGQRDVMPPRGGGRVPLISQPSLADRGMGGGMGGGGVMGKQWNNMGGGMGGGGGVRMDTARGMGGSFGFHGGANSGPMGGMGGGMGIARPPVGGVIMEDPAPRRRRRRPDGGGAGGGAGGGGGGVIMEDPAPRRRKTGGGGGGMGGFDITGQWNPNQPAGAWSARGGGAGGGMGGVMGEWDNVPQPPVQRRPQSVDTMTTGMGGGMGGPRGIISQEHADRINREAAERASGGAGGGTMGGGMGGSPMGGGSPAKVERNSVSQGTYQPQQGARAGLGQPMQSRTAVMSGNQQGTVGGAFNNQPSAESDMSDSPDVGGGMGTARAGGGFNRRPPQNFGPTGGFSTATRTQDLGSPMGDGRGTGSDGRPVGGGPVGGGPIGQPSPMSPTPQPSAPRNYGGGFGMMSPYGGQQPQINQDFSFSSNMFGQNPMMQMAQKQPKARQFAPRQGRSQSRTIGNLANLARQRRNLRFGWG